MGDTAHRKAAPPLRSSARTTPVLERHSVAEPVDEGGELPWELGQKTVEGAGIEERADGAAEAGMIPPECVKARVGPDDPVTLLDRRRERPCAHDLVRVAEILQEEMPFAPAAATASKQRGSRPAGVSGAARE